MSANPLTELLPHAKCIENMTLAEVQSELRAYQPLTAADVKADRPWKASRAALWRRFDQLVKSK
jgi:hypothetical protein